MSSELVEVRGVAAAGEWRCCRKTEDVGPRLGCEASQHQTSGKRCVQVTGGGRPTAAAARGVTRGGGGGGGKKEKERRCLFLCFYRSEKSFV